MTLATNTASLVEAAPMHSILTTQVSLQYFPVPPLPWHQRFNFLQFCRLFLRQPQQPESARAGSLQSESYVSWRPRSSPRHRSWSLQGYFPRDTTPTQSGLGTVGEGMQSDAVAGSWAGIQRRFPHKLRVGPQAGRQIPGGSARFACKGRGLRSRRPLSHLHSHRQLELDDQLDVARRRLRANILYGHLQKNVHDG